MHKRHIWKYLIAFLLIFSTKSAESQSQKKILSYYKTLSKFNFNSFKWCDLYERDGENISIYDFKKSDVEIRFLFKDNSGNYLLRFIFPNMDKQFTSINSYDENVFKIRKLDRSELIKNIEIFTRNKIQEIKYSKNFDGVIIKANNVIFLNLLSNNQSIEIPNGYKSINKSWYYLKSSGLAIRK
jgi:hypothetical protein